MLIKCKVLLFDFPTLYLAWISHRQARQITILKPHEFLWYNCPTIIVRELRLFILVGISDWGCQLGCLSLVSRVSSVIKTFTTFQSSQPPTSLLSVSFCPPRLASSQSISRSKVDWDFNVLYANENQIKVNPLSWSNFSIDIQIRWKYLWSKSKYTTPAVKLSVIEGDIRWLFKLLTFSLICSANKLKS